MTRLRKANPSLLADIVHLNDITIGLREVLEKCLLVHSLLLLGDGEVDVLDVALLAGLEQSSNSPVRQDDVVGASVSLVC